VRELIIEEPYEFVPPYRGQLWLKLLWPLVPWYLKRGYGLESLEWRGLEHLEASIAAGHGVLLAVNHCRPSDPVVMTYLSRQVRQPFYTMASWHLFKQAAWRRGLIRRMGGFSVYREGMDRTAVSYAVKVLESAERPIVIFPEGVISRSNGVLLDLMAGTTFIARSAARKRAKAEQGIVVIHPVAILYRFHGDLEAALDPVLTEIEERLTWRPQTHLSLFDRTAKVGTALLGLKEKEYLGETREGPLDERIERLSNAILNPIEDEHVDGAHEGDVVGRVKRLRIAILPDMIEGDISAAERERRWHQLDDIALTQQMACFPPDYLDGSMVAERYLETVERLEEDITGSARIHRPMSAVVQVGPALEVSADRPRKGEPDTLLEELEKRLGEMIATLAAEEQRNGKRA
jgi:1-acyl-sn-glycerol-3-phosphate acyltransferase